MCVCVCVCVRWVDFAKFGLRTSSPAPLLRHAPLGGIPLGSANKNQDPDEVKKHLRDVELTYWMAIVHEKQFKLETPDGKTIDGKALKTVLKMACVRFR